MNVATRSAVFLDRDGTLIEEPPDERVDRLEKIRLLPDVIPALLALKRAGFSLVMVTNQDGLGTPALPQDAFDRAHRFTLELFSSQGIDFEAVFICPHFLHDACGCRKPTLGLVEEYLKSHPIDVARSFMVGDRDTDLEFARNIGIDGLRVRVDGAAAEGWPAIAERILGAARRGRTERKTRETHVVVDVDLSREAPSRIATGIGFFDHMLEQLAKHGGFSMQLTCQGDLQIDEHHTVEDCALALGTALRQALGDKRGIDRYGAAVESTQPDKVYEITLPMDETLARAALDLSGRAYFVFDGTFPREKVGELPTELVPHFFRSLCDSLGANLHLAVRGDNAHHMIEACFKAVARALRQALRRQGDELPSTKGVL